MHATPLNRIALAAAVSTLMMSGALAGGGARGGGAVFHTIGGFHGGPIGHGGWGGGRRSGGQRGLPPLAGVIHERAGMRPYFSAYGHTDTAARFGGFAAGGVPAYGHTATALPSSGDGFRPFAPGYGRVDTALRSGAGRGFGAGAAVRRRFAGRGYVGGGYGFGDGTYGAPGIYGDAGVYGGGGTYGDAGAYGQAGTYGGEGTTATQSVYGTGGGTTYHSEVPLAARFAEPPLGPSRYAPYSPGDRYAYAASADARPGPRVVNPYRGAGSDCGCGGRAEPVIYRYGVGTAY